VPQRTVIPLELPFGTYVFGALTITGLLLLVLGIIDKG
jgi:hypothetical protein